uniref:Putative toll-like receptor 13 n=1 Tax=Lutzomyia longipalpis TaxID=7200 RepID=A0A1B0CGP8_LUTLO
MGPSGRDLVIFAIFLGTVVRVIECPDTLRRRQRHVVPEAHPEWPEGRHGVYVVNSQGQRYRTSSHNLDSERPTNSIPDRLVDELLASGDNSAQTIDHFASPVTEHTTTLSPWTDFRETIVYSAENTDGTTITELPSTTEDYEDSRETYIPGQGRPDCILGPAEIYLSWWLKNDGSLRTSATRRPAMRLTESKIYEKIRSRLQERQLGNFPIVFLSIAKNGLTRIPFDSLQLVTGSLEYLSLTGNSLQILDANTYSESTVFPAMEQLKELDVRRCLIEVIANNAFTGLRNLRKLYLSHNRITELSGATFVSLPLLMHLDVSFNTPELWETPLHMGDALERAIGGVRLAPETFAGLEKLKFLDFSHTRVEAASTNAFSHLPRLVQQLSLCHTGVQIIGYGMFNGTNLQVLDISGNPQLTNTMRANTFEGLEDKLEILSFQDSNVKHLSWLQHLTKLRMLMLRGNNINQLSNTTFIHTPQLEILDLSANHIGNWYTRIFDENRLLRILNLRENNINMMTTQMLDDFERLEFLGIGKNDFICSCILREFIDMAANNNRPINLIANNAFTGLRNLRKLYLSHNRITELSGATFVSLPLLMHLDVSFNTPELWETPLHMGDALERAIGAYGMFNGTNLQVLDISGNPQLTNTMRANTFEGLEDKLEILSFQDSNVKHLSWLQHLTKLRMLMLRGNNINQLSNTTFIHTPQLEILDLSANHIGNWYTRVFDDNRLLRILNLRENNINMMTTQMLDDFERLEFLGIGKNDFICSCILREFIDMAANNNRPINCTIYVNPMPDINDFLIEEVIQHYHENIDEKRTRRSVPQFTAKAKYDLLYISQAEFERLGAETQKNGFRAVELKDDENCTRQAPPSAIRKCPQRFQPRTTTEIIFTFQLLDFQENDYRCINSSTNREHFFSEIESCLSDRSNWPNLVQSLRQANNSLVTILIVAFILLTIFCFGYYKWWYIRYFLIIIKNATILSFLDKEKEKVRQGASDDAFMYDVFVSFCDENRPWVLEELLPNIEARREISVCMHERDFQVGVSILENIISCMDRSRCLLLVISQSFLLSQ